MLNNKAQVTQEVFDEYVKRMTSHWNDALIAGTLQRINIKDKATNSLLGSDSTPVKLPYDMTWNDIYFEVEVSDISDETLKELEKEASTAVDDIPVSAKKI